MREKVYCIIYLCCFLYCESLSQIGFRYGFNLANMSAGNEETVKSKFLLRQHFAISTKIANVSDNTVCMLEFMFSQKGQNYFYQETFRNTDGGTYTIDTRYKNKFSYLDMPLVFHTKITENFGLEYGAYTGLLLSGKRKGSTTTTTSGPGYASSTNIFPEDASYSDKTKWPSGMDARRPVKPYDTGILFGFNFSLKQFLSGAVFGMRYVYGLTDVMNNNYPIKNTSRVRETHGIIQLSIMFYKN
ncbi:MAG: PorT family protein [Cytophagaceae bacterium]|nr:PorT family protein [Cytophagaceae bacterium]MDW8456386.1 outer membrane beta-barrel protein [Cytophagaceae bacterium]